VHYWFCTLKLKHLQTPLSKMASAQVAAAPQLISTNSFQSASNNCNANSNQQQQMMMAPYVPSALPQQRHQQLTRVNSSSGSGMMPVRTLSLPLVPVGGGYYNDGMEVVWHGEFSRLFSNFYPPHVWFLTITTQAPQFKWKYHRDSAKVRFCCQECGNGWTSMKGRVIFWFHLNHATNEGFVQFKLYGQQCKKCNSGKFEYVMWYPEEVSKVMSNLYHKVGQTFYGFMQPPIRIDRRPGRPRNQHNADLCQACRDGECDQGRRVKPADSPSGDETIQPPPAVAASQRPQAINATQMYLADTKSHQPVLQNESSPPPLVISSSSAVCLPSGTQAAGIQTQAVMNNGGVKPVLIQSQNTMTATAHQGIATAFYTPKCYPTTGHIFYAHHPFPLQMAPNTTAYNLHNIPFMKPVPPRAGAQGMSSSRITVGGYPSTTWSKNEVTASAATIKEIEDKISKINISASLNKNKNESTAASLQASKKDAS